MSSRGSAFGRTMTYFRSVDIEEADAALTAAIRIVQGRQAAATPPKAKVARTRKRKVANVDGHAVAAEARAAMASEQL
jgi:hypothetical protein